MTKTTKLTRRGRPTKLNAETAQTIYKALLLGLTLEEAATFAGVCEDTLTNWKKRGEKEKSGPYHDFLGLIKKAEPQRAANCLAAIQQAITGEKGKRTIRKYDKQGNLLEEREEEFWLRQPEWTAAAWKLERMLPDRFGRQVPLVQQNNIQNNQNSELTTVVAEVRNLSDEQIQARIAELREARKQLRGE